ncbi:MAG: hypothetical protein ACLP9L_07700 [Thermoguttaceae bacterium]
MSGSRKRRANKAAQEAWQAIDYLVEHELVVRWEFPESDPPPEAIKRLLKPYFADGEIERGTAWHLRDYLVERLEEDFLAVADERSQNHAPWSRPVCRIVCCGDDED